MGIFKKFLKKGPAAEDLDRLEIKGTAYDNTPQSLPPIRGTLPVQGNGPNTLDELQRSAKVRRDGPAPASSSVSGGRNSPAPSNRVARLRSMSLGRPSTAPGSGGAATGAEADERPKSSSGRTPRDPSKTPATATASASSSVTAPKRKHGPPYLLGVVGPSDSDANSGKSDKNAGNTAGDDLFSELDAPPPVPSIAEHFKQPPPPSSPSVASGRIVLLSEKPTTARHANSGSISGSILSAGGSTTTAATARMGGYVDLLDAQGALKPSDFRSRIRAAGVRDYGEDVADRNIGVNGVDLGSPAVMAFYALAGGQALVYKSDGSARDVHGHTYTPGNIPLHLRSQDEDEEEQAAADQRRALRFPARTTSLEPGEEITRTSTPGHTTRTTEERAAAYEGGRFDSAAALAAAQRRRVSVHGSVLSPSTSQQYPKQARPVSMHPILSDPRSDEADEAASVPDIPRRRPTPHDAAAGSGPWDDPMRMQSPRSQSRARDSVLVTRKQQRDGSGRRSRAKGKAKQQQQQQEAYSEESEGTGRPRSRSSAARRRKHGKARAVDEAGLTTHMLHDDEDAIPPLPSYVIGQPGSSRPSSSSSQTRARTRSIGASPARGRSAAVNQNQLHDITEYIPNRRSSLSVSSIPSSSLSSNLFPSSQSRHTADTSVDLCYTSSGNNNHPLQLDTTPSSDQKSYAYRSKPRSGTVTSGGSSTRLGGYEDQRAHPPALHFSRGANAAATASSDDDDDDVVGDGMTTTTDGSDVDSFVKKRRRHRRKQVDGEGLLFREGAYGVAGGGLPGLFSPDDHGRHGHGDEEDDDCDSMIAGDTAPVWPSSLRHPYASRRRSASSRPRSAVPSILSSHGPPPIPSWDTSLTVHGKTSNNNNTNHSNGGLRYQHYHPGVDQDDDTSTVSDSEAGGRTSRAGSSVYDDDDDDDDKVSNRGKEEGIAPPVMTGAHDQIDVRLAMRLRREMERRSRAVRSTSAVRPKSMSVWNGYEKKGIRADAKV